MPIYYAAQNGHYKVVEALIAKGAHVNNDIIDGCNPLTVASEYGHHDIVNLLVKNGAKVNAVTCKGSLTPLHVACNHGHIDVVKSLLDVGAKYDNDVISSDNEMTPFHLSVKNNYIGVVRTFIEKNINVNILTKSGLTALHLTYRNVSSDMTDLLIQNKARVNYKTNDHYFTPLFMASANGSYQVVETLIKNKAEVNVKNVDGHTALHAATRGNHKDVVTLLLENKADVDSPDAAGRGPLHISALYGAKEAAQVLLINFANVNMRDNLDCTPLHIASDYCQLDIAKLLVDHRADVNYCSSLSGTPLFLAVNFGNRDTVNLLLNNGAKFESNVENKEMISRIIRNDRTDLLRIMMSKGVKVFKEEPAALAKAIVAGSKRVVEMLLPRKRKEENKNFYVDNIINQDEVLEFASSKVISKFKSLRGLTPLLLASALGNKDIVEMLVRSGADLNSKTSDGSSALHLAASLGRSDVEVLGNLEIVKNLVEHGADVNLKNEAGSKPVHIAAQEGHLNIVEYFISLGLSVEERGTADQTLLHYAALKGQLDVVEFLIQKQSAQPNVYDKNGCSPLHLAAFSGSKTVVEYLLKSGCFFNTTNVNKKKPSEVTSVAEVQEVLENTEKLLAAAKKNDFSAISALVERGAVLNAVHSNSGTALHWAAWKGFNDLAKSMLRNGCNPNIKDKHGFTPLHYAVKFSHYKVVLALVSNEAVLDSLSNSGKTPLDLCKDKKIEELLMLISKLSETGNVKITVM